MGRVDSRGVMEILVGVLKPTGTTQRHKEHDRHIRWNLMEFRFLYLNWVVYIGWSSIFLLLENIAAHFAIN